MFAAPTAKASTYPFTCHLFFVIPQSAAKYVRTQSFDNCAQRETRDNVYVENMSYLFLLATATHTRRIIVTATITKMTTSQSGGRKNKSSILELSQSEIKITVSKEWMQIGMHFSQHLTAISLGVRVLCEVTWVLT